MASALLCFCRSFPLGIDPTIGYAVNVINKYFNVYFPNAIETALQLRKLGGQERLIYTTHPWLVSIYINCSVANVPGVLFPSEVSLECPSAEAVEAFNAAVLRGDIAYHAYPFNVEAEFLDTSLYQFGVTMAHKLDEYYGFSPRIVLK
jgi:hypothetical protein